MLGSSSDDANAADLLASVFAALRAARWSHRESLDALRDAICAFAVDLEAKGLATGEIAVKLREVVNELRAAREELPAELSDADPSLEETVSWCLEFGVGTESQPQHGDHGGSDWNSSRLEGDAQGKS